jgi:hypothetical protein
MMDNPDSLWGDVYHPVVPEWRVCGGLLCSATNVP